MYLVRISDAVHSCCLTGLPFQNVCGDTNAAYLAADSYEDQERLFFFFFFWWESYSLHIHVHATKETTSV